MAVGFLFYMFLGTDLVRTYILQVLFPLIPQLCDIERMKRGGEHWEWSPETPFYIGLLPRRGAKPTDVKAFIPVQ